MWLNMWSVDMGLETVLRAQKEEVECMIPSFVAYCAPVPKALRGQMCRNFVAMKCFVDLLVRLYDFEVISHAANIVLHPEELEAQLKAPGVPFYTIPLPPSHLPVVVPVH